MSEQGQTTQTPSINASAAQIKSPLLRDIVIAICVLARPVGTALCGFALAWVGMAIGIRALTQSVTEWDFAVITVVAAAFGVAVGARSWDKATAAKTGGQ